jgi:hypothetical protein
MKIRLFLSTVSILPVVAIAVLSLAGGPQNNGKAQSLVGTYKLIMRQLPDGTKLTAPEVMGLLTYTKTHRNFNVIWKDANGKFFSYSLVSTYKLTAGEYTETVLFSMLNDQISGQPIKYDLTGPSQTVPVTITGSRIEIKMPFDPVTIVFDQNWVTGKAEGRFTDYWERVE